MNTLFRSTLVAALIVLPAAAFAQSVAQVDETQVETIAYDVGAQDSSPAQTHTIPMSNAVGAHTAIISDPQFNPAADVGLKSIYTHH
jgi:hypothetical protein